GAVAQHVAPEALGGGQPPQQRSQLADLHRGEVLALLEVAGVRAGPGEDHRMAVLDRDRRVVPAPPEVIAAVVVRCVGDPGWLWWPVRALRQIDEDLLPVRLV